MVDGSKVEACIDHVCALGCRLVTQCIQDLERGRQRPEYETLNKRERDALLRELRAIMAVYEQDPDEP